MASARPKRRGRLVVIGGNEDMRDDDLRILPRVVELAGGKEARLLVCAAASADPEPTLRAYERDLRRIGIADIHPAPLNSREEAEQDDLLGALEACSGVFLTGGDQLRVTSLVAGTTFGDRLIERYEHDGLLVAGSSAGAVAMSSTMISRGIGETVRRSAFELAPGLGLLRDVTIDAHFDRSGRVHRLMAVLAQNPATLGLGVDEDTAVEVLPAGRFTVLGCGVVMVFDGRVTHTNTADVTPQDALALTDVRLHVLPAGYGFDLTTREPIVPAPGRRSPAARRRLESGG
jgi:cyanophycinase